MSIITSNCILSFNRENDDVIITKNKSNLQFLKAGNYVSFTLSGLKKTISFEFILDYEQLKKSGKTIFISQGNQLLDDVLMMSAELKDEDNGKSLRITGHAFYADLEGSISQLEIDSGWMDVEDTESQLLVQLSPEFSATRVFSKNGIENEKLAMNVIPSEDLQIRKTIMKSLRGRNLFISPIVKELNIYDVSIAPVFF